MEKVKKIGRFQFTLKVIEFVDTGEHIEAQPISEYQESCWTWKDTKEAIEFFTKRIEDKIDEN